MTYDWDFGDNTTGTGATPSHAYAVEGAYIVTLTVTDDAGAIASDGTVAGVLVTSDLSVGSVTVTPNLILVGDLVDHVVVISNNGPNDEPAATAAFTLPSSATLSSVNASQGTCAALLGVVACDLGLIAAGDEATITVIVISPPPPDALTLSVTVDGESFDSDSSNNSLTVTSNVVAAVTVRAKAEGGGAFGAIEMLLLIMAAALMRIRRVRRATDLQNEGRSRSCANFSAQLSWNPCL